MKKKLLIIGAGRWHLPLFCAAKKLGCSIIATDLYADSPGFALADLSCAIDVRDIRATLDFAKKCQIDAVVTGVDLAVPTAARIAKELGLPGLCDSVASLVSNKVLMRKHLRSLGLAGPRFFFEALDLGSAAQAAETIGYPCIVKPVDNCGSRGVSVAATAGQLSSAFERAKKASFSGSVLVEEFMVGREASVEGLVDRSGKLFILGVSDKLKSDLPHRFDLELHYPGDFTPGQYAAIERYVGALVRGFGITTALIHVELLLADEQVRLIEVAARGCGSHVIGKLIPKIIGVDVLRLMLRQALGESIELPKIQTGHGILKFLIPEIGTVSAIEGMESVLASRNIIDFSLDLNIGDETKQVSDTSGRRGYIMAHAENRAEADAVVREALARLRTSIVKRSGYGLPGERASALR